MSFDLVKNNLMAILKAKGYKESDTTTFDEVPALQYDNTCIVRSLSGEMGENSETLSDRFYDVQEWEITIAFSKSSQSDVINRDDAQRKKDDLIKAFDKPANWSTVSGLMIQKYKSWKMEEQKSYFLLTILVKVLDRYIYT